MSPFELRGRELRNPDRVDAARDGWGGSSGLLERSEVDYQVRKAAGGCGLVMTFGSASVDATTAASYGSVALWDERSEPALRALAAGVHEHGGVCMSQMTHMGRRGHSRETGIPQRAPSDVPEPVHREVPVPLEEAECGGGRGRRGRARGRPSSMSSATPSRPVRCSMPSPWARALVPTSGRARGPVV